EAVYSEFRRDSIVLAREQQDSTFNVQNHMFIKNSTHARELQQQAELSVTAASTTPTLRARTSVALPPTSAANAYNENTTLSTTDITIAVTLRKGTSSATTPVTPPVHARPADPARHRAIEDQFTAGQNEALQRHTNDLSANFWEAVARRMDDEFDGEMFDKNECQKHYNEPE
ncbi:hypothetical protein LTR28_008548, partial [Elasticomyces elasticus]